MSADDGWALTIMDLDKAGYRLPVQHIAPIEDVRSHTIHRECPCKPKIQIIVDTDGGALAVQRSHNAWDGRE